MFALCLQETELSANKYRPLDSRHQFLCVPKWGALCFLFLAEFLNTNILFCILPIGHRINFEYLLLDEGRDLTARNSKMGFQ